MRVSGSDRCGARKRSLMSTASRGGEGGGDVTTITRGFAVPASAGRRGSVGVLPFPLPFLSALGQQQTETGFVFVPSHLAPARSRLGPSPLPSKHNHSASWSDWKSPYPNPLDRDRKGKKGPCRCRMAVVRGNKIALSLCVTKIGDDRISPRRPPSLLLPSSSSLSVDDPAVVS